MKYLLDTNACIVYLNRPDSLVRTKMQQHKPSQIYLCSVVKSELFFGAMKSQQTDKALQKLELFFANLPSVPFDDIAAKRLGEIRAYLQQRGTPIGPYDLQIAAIALANEFTVVTHNTREFLRVPMLQVEDWEMDIIE
jgi:tRNA(fMet)-specific endonuclease VapC